MDAVHEIAQQAVDDATTRAGSGNAKVIAAEVELGEGEDDAALDRLDKAVDHYKNAWKIDLSAK